MSLPRRKSNILVFLVFKPLSNIILGILFKLAVSMGLHLLLHLLSTILF